MPWTECEASGLSGLWRLRFAFEGGDGDGGSGHFYVCKRTAELNEHFGDLLHKIQDLEVSDH